MVPFSAGEGGAWPCVQCGYAAKEEKYLIRHMRYRHSGILIVIFKYSTEDPVEFSRSGSNLSI